MPPDTEAMTLSYHYEPYGKEEITVEGGRFTSQAKINTIDLGLFVPDGTQAGASGSDKVNITISETYATPGYTPITLTAGEWQILVGAYKVATEGVTVQYTIEFTPKALRLFKGDLHTHTLGSDGVLTVEELTRHAMRHGLDFLAITDHNQMVSTEALLRIPGITLIPGVEWTHYQGHANFLGVDKPYDEPFVSAKTGRSSVANTLEDAAKIFESARDRGALITLNHPYEESCPYKFKLDALPFDCLEVWNDPMRESNLRAIGLWQSLLVGGKRIPIVGGSDYHRDTLFQILGGPCMGVYALSNSPSDILAAIAQGHAYIVFAPDGPTLSIHANDAIMGDSLMWKEGLSLQLHAEGLKTGDVIMLVNKQDTINVFEAPSDGSIDLAYPVSSPGFILSGNPAHLPARYSSPAGLDQQPDLF